MSWGQIIAKKLLMFVLGFLLQALAVMLIWNAIIPDLVQWPELMYGQAVLLLLLTRILTGNLYCGSWKNRGENKTSLHFSDEQKDQLKKKFMDRCGWPEDK